MYLSCTPSSPISVGNHALRTVGETCMLIRLDILDHLQGARAWNHYGVVGYAWKSERFCKIACFHVVSEKHFDSFQSIGVCVWTQTIKGLQVVSNVISCYFFRMLSFKIFH